MMLLKHARVDIRNVCFDKMLCSMKKSFKINHFPWSLMHSKIISRNHLSRVKPFLSFEKHDKKQTRADK